MFSPSGSADGQHRQDKVTDVQSGMLSDSRPVFIDHLCQRSGNAFCSPPLQRIIPAEENLLFAVAATLNAAVVRMVDKHWYSLLVYRILECGEQVGKVPSLQSDCSVEAIPSSGPGIPLWKFQKSSETGERTLFWRTESAVCEFQHCLNRCDQQGSLWIR